MKMLVILSPDEYQGLLRVSAKLDVTPLYSLRYLLIESLYERGLLDPKVRNALLCKVLERKSRHRFEIEVENIIPDTFTIEETRDLPPELAGPLDRKRRLFAFLTHLVKRFEITGILEFEGVRFDETKLKWWLEEAGRYGFLPEAQKFKELLEKFISESLSISLTGDEVSGGHSARKLREKPYCGWSRTSAASNKRDLTGDISTSVEANREIETGFVVKRKTKGGGELEIRITPLLEDEGCEGSEGYSRVKNSSSLRTYSTVQYVRGEKEASSEESFTSFTTFTKDLNRGEDDELSP